jgi:beta-glucosidase
MFNHRTISGRRTLLAAGLILISCVGPALGQQAGAATPPYLNPSLPLDQRVDDLISRFTMEEKAGQLVNQAAAIPRLQIPAYNWWNESLHGLRANNATVFPQVIGLGSTFDAPLIKEMATAISLEARGRFHEGQRQAASGGAAGFGRLTGLDFWAPNINIFRDPRWGRGQETYGEDPFLTARMGVAFVTGMQGDDPKYFRTISTPKHYAVHSGPESTRHFADVKVSLHDMEDTYLPAFRATVVDAKADSVMCAYNRINGEPACVNTFLLQDTLRGAWKFNGYVVSDCGAISDIYQGPGVGHNFVKTLPDAAALSLKKGTDSDCAMSQDVPSYLKAMQDNLISQKEVDVNLKRLFKARFQLGLFDPPEMVKYAQIPATETDSEEHRKLALKMAREVIVLLKNDGALPLKASVKNIAVVGPLADSLVALEGNYNGTPSRYTTLIDGIRKQFAGAKVTYTPGTKFLRNSVVVPESAYHTADGKPGLAAAYFKSKDLSGQPVASRTEPRLGNAMGMGGFGGGGRGAGAQAQQLPAEVATGDFSARWTSVITAPDSGKFEFTIAGGGGVRVSLDGKVIIEDWVQRAMGGRGGNAAANAAATAARTTEVALEKGKNYELKVEFFRDAAALTAAANATAAAAAAAATAAAQQPAGPGRGFGAMPVTAPTLTWNYGNDRETAVAAAKQADVVVAVVGITAQLEGEQGSSMGQLPEGFTGGDRTLIDLPKDEQALLEAMKATGKPLVAVLMNGSAMAVNWANQNANAILEAWYPGEEGGAAVAETLAGVNNPAGRLPLTFYKSLDGLPPFEDYSMKGRTYRYFEGQPLYPFGSGLSYSKFAYSNVKLSTPTVKAGANLQVDVDVRNASSVAGDEVAQLYLTFPKLPGAPIRALRGFERVRIAPGQTQHVRFTLDPRDLSCVNEAGDRLVAAGAYRVFVGGGQPGTSAPGMEAPLTIQGEAKLPR